MLLLSSWSLDVLELFKSLFSYISVTRPRPRTWAVAIIFHHQFIHVFSACFVFFLLMLGAGRKENGCKRQQRKNVKERQNKYTQEHTFLHVISNIIRANIIHQYHSTFLSLYESIRTQDNIYRFCVWLCRCFRLPCSVHWLLLYRIIIFFIIIMSYKNLKYPPDLWS